MPNCVRHCDSGAFPNNTLFLLNACRGARSGLSSAFRDMLFEKCNEGACFAGCAGKVFYPRAARATLYLLQLLTASNEEKIVAGKTVLQKLTPPQGGKFTFLLIALSELNTKLCLTGLDGGAQLTPWARNNAIILSILAPHPRRCSPTFNGPWDLRMFAWDQPTVTVGGAIVTTTTTNLKTKAVTTSNSSQSVSVDRYGVSLSKDRTVAGASFQQNVGCRQRCSTCGRAAFVPTAAARGRAHLHLLRSPGDSV